MNFVRRLNFLLWYLGRPPWDSGIVPPEVEKYISSHPPGRALDLGCGTGTSSLALARAGWSVTGVDFVERAIKKAEQKARSENLSVDFHQADVTHLPASIFMDPYDLVLDIGCFHGLSPSGRKAYLDQLDRLLAPGGNWVMYGFFKPGEAPGPGLRNFDLEQILNTMILIERQDGVDRRGRPSAWFWLKSEEG